MRHTDRIDSVIRTADYDALGSQVNVPDISHNEVNSDDGESFLFMSKSEADDIRATLEAAGIAWHYAVENVAVNGDEVRVLQLE